MSELHPEQLITYDPAHAAIHFSASDAPGEVTTKHVAMTSQFNTMEVVTALAMRGPGTYSRNEIAADMPDSLTVSRRLSHGATKKIYDGYVAIETVTPGDADITIGNLAVATLVPPQMPAGDRVRASLAGIYSARVDMQEKPIGEKLVTASLGHEHGRIAFGDRTEFAIPLGNAYGNIAFRIIAIILENPGARLDVRDLFATTMRSLSINQRTPNKMSEWISTANSGRQHPQYVFGDVLRSIVPTLTAKGLIKMDGNQCVVSADSGARLSFVDMAGHTRERAPDMALLTVNKKYQPLDHDPRRAKLMRPTTAGVPYKTLPEHEQQPIDAVNIALLNAHVESDSYRVVATHEDAISLLDIIMNPAYDESLRAYMMERHVERRTLSGFKDSVHGIIKKRLGVEAYDEAVLARTIAAHSWHNRNQAMAIRQTGGAVNRAETRLIERGQPRDAKT